MAIKVIMLLSSLVMIFSVLLQESKSDGLSGSIGGGAEQLFGKRKSMGYDAILHKTTLVSSIAFFVTAIVGVVL